MRFSQLVTSNSDTVSLDLSDSTGKIKRVTVPSFAAIMAEVKRLSNSVEALSGAGQRSASVKLSDGKFRKVLVTSLKKEAADIAAMPLPKTFNKRENWFFESFLNPLLYVSFDLSDQILSNTEKVEVHRYILNLDTEAKKKIFETSMKGNSAIQFQDFYQSIVDNEITFFDDHEVVDLPPRTLRFFGNFSVTDLFDETVDTTSDGVAYQKRVLRLRLDTLKYNDRQSRFKLTQSLKVGDSLLVNSGNKDTRYRIDSIEAETRTVNVSVVEGFEPIQIGVDMLSFYDVDSSSVSVDVNVGFNESCVIFIKPIDPESKIASVNWSPGVGLFTNELTIIDDSGQETTLDVFYQNQVIDFGAYLYSIAKEKIPPAIFGIVPDAPTISSDNFKVVQINEHITSNSSVQDLKKLHSEKGRLQSQINTIDRSISSLRSKIETTNYVNKKTEDTDKNELARLISDRDSVSKLFASSVDDINQISTAQSLGDTAPKYRVRGFFPIPEPKTTNRTGAQSVVQFVIQYRYLKKDGSANQPTQIQFLDNAGEPRRGTFSTWNEIKSPVRTRIVDPATGESTWNVEDVEDGDAVNINQVDIPISQNEAIELRIKSLSEAGWPVNPKESVWSETVRVDFPSDLESIQSITSITDEANKDRAKIELRKELDNLGITEHVNSSFNQSSKYFAHSARELASGFFTSEQNVIPLFDKLKEMEETIFELRAMIDKSRAVLIVKVVDELGQEHTVEKNSTLKLFAGNYREQVSSFVVKKGVIITKNYFLKVFNEKQSSLEMYAREFGSRYFKITPSYTAGTDFRPNDTDYNRIRRYDYVPLSLSSPPSDEVQSYGFIRNYPEQSSQVLGQFMALRYTAIDGRKNLYSEVTGVTYGVYDSRSLVNGSSAYVSTVTEDIEYVADSAVLDSLVASTNVGSTAVGDFIWKGGTNGSWVIPYTDSTVQSSYNDSLFVHIKHPLISSWAGMFTSDSDVNEHVQNEVRNSIFANVPFGSTGSDRQSALFYEAIGGTADKYGKIGFVDTDQYLLGPRSVGSYLFFNPKSHDVVTVPGSDNLSFKTLRFGTREALTVPITFQYRMTDYFGSEDSGLGNLGGNPSTGVNSTLAYTKTIGIDIFPNPVENERFSFDLELTARYYSKSLVSKETPLRTFENTIDDLTGQILTLRPQTSRDSGNR